MLSVIGLNDSLPENAIAVTMVGDARKFIVSPFPSFRDLKFLLKLVKIATGNKLVDLSNEGRLWSYRFLRLSCLHVSTGCKMNSGVLFQIGEMLLPDRYKDHMHWREQQHRRLLIRQ